MRKLYVTLGLAAVLALPFALGSRTLELCEGFLPENDMKIGIGTLEDKGMSEAEFNEVLDKIQAHYAPIIEAKGGTLQINRLWSNNTVNASAQRRGSTYIINMYGGLARHKTITQDGFALVACHEIGHHIGGAPKVSGWMGWASNEGQCDYFANMKCLRLIFGDESAQEFSRADIKDAFAAAACSKAFSDPTENALCLRGALGGASVSALFQELRKEEDPPSFATPDPKVVTRTNDRHPATQCRMDTYFQGSLCTKPVSEDVNSKDPAPGTCTRAAGYDAGIRPLCWFKPAASAEEGLVSSGNGGSNLPLSRRVPNTALNRLGSSIVWDGI